MLFRPTNYNTSVFPYPVTLEEALDHSCKNTDRLRRVLGKIVPALYDTSILTDFDIEEMLGREWEREEAE
jgi:hypothetical protein